MSHVRGVARCNEGVRRPGRRRSSARGSGGFVEARNAEARATDSPKARWSCSIGAGETSVLGAGRPLTTRHSTPGREPPGLKAADWPGAGQWAWMVHKLRRRAAWRRRRWSSGYFGGQRGQQRPAEASTGAFRCRWTSRNLARRWTFACSICKQPWGGRAGLPSAEQLIN